MLRFHYRIYLRSLARHRINRPPLATQDCATDPHTRPEVHPVRKRLQMGCRRRANKPQALDRATLVRSAARKVCAPF